MTRGRLLVLVLVLGCLVLACLGLGPLLLGSLVLGSLVLAATAAVGLLLPAVAERAVALIRIDASPAARWSWPP